MSTNEISNYLKNTKIENKKLKQICQYFAKDYTASQTAKKLELSRQTINNYYKIIRNLLLEKQNELISFIKINDFCNNSFSIKYIKTGNYICYFIECNQKVFFINSQEDCLPNINKFINKYLDSSLLTNRKVNCAKVLFNQKEKKYLIIKIFKTDNNIQEFIDYRLKKFRGVNKQKLILHLKESQFRYNYSSEFLYETLLSLLNLNNKTSTF